MNALTKINPFQCHAMNIKVNRTCHCEKTLSWKTLPARLNNACQMMQQVLKSIIT